MRFTLIPRTIAAIMYAGISVLSTGPGDMIQSGDVYCLLLRNVCIACKLCDSSTFVCGAVWRWRRERRKRGRVVYIIIPIIGWVEMERGRGGWWMR